MPIAGLTALLSRWRLWARAHALEALNLSQLLSPPQRTRTLQLSIVVDALVLVGALVRVHVQHRAKHRLFSRSSGHSSVLPKYRDPQLDGYRA